MMAGVTYEEAMRAEEPTTSAEPVRTQEEVS
jgi:hypothetical protein